MGQTLAITEAVTTLAEVETKFNLKPAVNLHFFHEWQRDLPELTPAEATRLDLIKRRYLYHRKHGPLAEATVNFIVIAPLLEMAGFYDPPFLLRSEVAVQIQAEEQEQILRGRIDALVLQDRLWVLILESKQTTFSTGVALPQALAYMIGSPDPDRPTYGLVSNGEYFIFLKLLNRGQREYAFSNDFSMYQQQNTLVDVLKILKKLGQLIQ
jgi:predicted type IV restriction endonuclease